jgi:hypothetical protein
MNKSTITINGELTEVMDVSAVFTHAVETDFFKNFDEVSIVELEVGEGLGGMFVSRVVLETDKEVTDADLNVLLSEFPESRVVIVLETEQGKWVVATEGAVAL